MTAERARERPRDMAIYHSVAWKRCLFILMGFSMLIAYHAFMTAQVLVKKVLTENNSTYIPTGLSLTITSLTSSGISVVITTFVLLSVTWSVRTLVIILEIQFILEVIGLILLSTAAVYWPNILGEFIFASALCINILGGSIQPFAYAIGGNFGYSELLLVGANLSGCIISFLNIIALSCNQTFLVYFLSAIVAICVCILMVGSIFLEKVDRKVDRKIPSIRQEPGSSIVEEIPLKGGSSIVEDAESKITTLLNIIKEGWMIYTSILLTFIVTLIVYPTVFVKTSLIPSTLFTDTYWISLSCFLSYNLFACIGSFLASFVQWGNASKFSIIATFLATAIFFIFRSFNINIVIYLVGVILFSTSSGFVGCNLLALQGRKDSSPMSMGLATCAINIGVIIGCCISSLLPQEYPYVYY